MISPFAKNKIRFALDCKLAERKCRNQFMALDQIMAMEAEPLQRCKSDWGLLAALRRENPSRKIRGQLAAGSLGVWLPRLAP